jgi:glycosyltransferase involved in cell wall biosynthesis
MLHSKRVVAVLPAYNAAKTLATTVAEIPPTVDEVILVDDHSSDDTVLQARELGLRVIQHERNKGYGGNQKTCYAEALDRGADVVVMLHPDYQYEPLLVTALAGMVASGVYDLVLGSRILAGGALRGGMPRYKYLANRCLTLFQNCLLGAKLSEYHTGFRAFSSELLRTLPLSRNSDDFVFDNEVLAQCIYTGARIGEISCPTRYFPEASSINFLRSIRYGLGVLRTTVECRLALWGWMAPARYAGIPRRPASSSTQRTVGKLLHYRPEARSPESETRPAPPSWRSGSGR